MIETWEWATDILRHNDGSEQRIMLRSQPRRTFNYTVITTALGQTRNIAERLFANAGLPTNVPMYQYATNLTASHSIGSTIISLAPEKTDLRVGEDCFFRNVDGSFHLGRVTIIGASSITLASGVEFDVTSATLCGPVFNCMLKDKSAIERWAVDDPSQVKVNAKTLQYRTSFKRTGATPVIATFNGLNILDRVPLAGDMVRDSFESNFKEIDFGYGTSSQNRVWTYVVIEGKRKFLLSRFPDASTDFDYFREFLDDARGMVKSFFIPTYRPDFIVDTAPVETGSSVTFEGDKYSGSYFPHPAFKSLLFETTSGNHYCTAQSVTTDGNGNDLVDFLPALPAGIGWTEFADVSILCRARLGSDVVKLTHWLV
jgi:hypothetical protein